MKIKKKQLEYTILIVLLVFTFFKTYSLHINYRFPYHQDEWQHLALSIQAMEEGYNKQYNPYLNIPNDHSDLELGFHLFLSSFFLITNLDPVLSYQYLAAIFAVISGFVIFLCCYRLSKNFLIGILSLIVFISLPTNVNILGKDFFVPLTMAIPFIFLYILFFLESLKEKNTNKFVFSLFILSTLFFVHPPSFIILLFPSILESLFNLNNIKKIYSNITKYTVFIVLLLFLVSIFLVAWKGTISATQNYILDLLFFEQGWGKLEVTYFIPLLYGLINTLFAIFGFIEAYKTEFRFFTVFAFFSLAITAFFNMLGYTILVPYSRAVHYTMLALIPLTAVGFNKFLEYINNFLHLRQKVSLTSIHSIIMILIFMFLIFSSKYELDLKYKNYQNFVITEPDYDALLWIKYNLGEKNVLITPYFMTSAIYPITKNQVISIIPAQMEGGLREENLNFYNYNCSDKKKIIDGSYIKFVLSHIHLDCDFLEQLYLADTNVYKVVS